MAENNQNNQSKISQMLQGNILAIAIVCAVLMLIIPLPTFLLDLLMSFNIALAITILLIVIYTPKSSNFTSFPRVILLVTILGLGLNVSSTRLILTQGANFNGSLIRAFSTFVVGSDEGLTGLLVGLIIFIILIVIQVLVISKGSTRIAEVAARFALDSMAQKNFAVDAELNSGAITEEEAQIKRAEIRRESDFFSAMDGSSKFVSGNVTAGIFITVINLVAGIITGIAIRHESNVFNTYCRLTIGDGLISQIPSLLISFSTGLIVTGSSSNELLSNELKKNFSVSGRVFIIAGASMALMGIFPGMPWFILIPFGAVAIYAGVKMLKAEKVEQERKLQEIQTKSGQTTTSKEKVSPVVPLDAMSLELGYALIPLVDEEKGAELLERITRIRQDFAIELGLVVPPIRIKDNMVLDPSEYCVKIKGIEVGRSKLKLGYYLCINSGNVLNEIPGEKTKDPTYGMDAIWVAEERRQEAESAGYIAVDPPTVIATHLTEIINKKAADIIGIKEVDQIINATREINSVVVDAITNTCKFTHNQILHILQNLLRERVSIRNIELIFETLADYNNSISIWILTEKVRRALGLQICLQYVDENKVLKAMQLSSEWETLFLERQVIPNDGAKPFAALDLADGRKWIKAIGDSFSAMRDSNMMPVVFCNSEVRALVKGATEKEIPGLVVLSVEEILACGNAISLEVVGEITKD